MSDGLQIKTLEQLLAEQGLDMSALTDPGARFGTQYGQGGAYGFAFTPFNIESYQQSAEALRGLEQSLMGGIEEQFGFERRGMQTGLSSELQKIQQMGRPSGLVGGARGRLMDIARRGAQESYGQLVGRTEQRRTSTQEQLGRQAAQLEGLFSSFLEGGTSRYLQLLQADPTGVDGPSNVSLDNALNIINSFGLNQAESTAAINYLKNNPMTADAFDMYLEETYRPQGDYIG